MFRRKAGCTRQSSVVRGRYEHYFFSQRTSDGCGAKIGPSGLSELSGLLTEPRPPADADLLVGFDTRADAAVYRMTGDDATVVVLEKAKIGKNSQ